MIRLFHKLFKFFFPEEKPVVVRPFELTMEEVVNKNKLKREYAIEYLGEKWILHPNNRVNKVKRSRRKKKAACGNS